MIQFDPTDPDGIAFALKKAVKQSGMTLEQIAQRLEQEYGEQLTASAISHNIWRGGVRFQRALQILAVCGIQEVRIKSD